MALADKIVPDSIRTLMIAPQTAEGAWPSSGFVPLRAITSFEPQFNDTYEMPRFENASGWGEEDAYGTTSTRGMRINAWLDTVDIGWFLGSVLRHVGVSAVDGGGPLWAHEFQAVKDAFSPNPTFAMVWYDGTNDGANAVGYALQDCRCTQLALAWDYMANSFRVTATVEARPYVDVNLLVQPNISTARAGILTRNRAGKIILPKHTVFKRGSTTGGTSYPLISGNITLNNGAGPIYGSTTGTDPDGTELDGVVPLRREDGDVSGRYDLTYDKQLMRASTSITPFDDYLTAGFEIWRIVAWGAGGGQKLELILPFGRAISGSQNTSGQRSTRSTVGGMIGYNASATYPFKAILTNSRVSAYYV